MNCEEFWNRMPELVVGDGGADHAAECSACGAKLAAQRRLAGALETLSTELEPVGAPAHVEAKLIETFRVIYPVKKRHAAWWQAPAIRWAAVVVAAAALALGFWISPKRRAEGPVTRHATPSQPGRVELASLNVEESDDGFIPLPNAPQRDPNDEVNVVRMELPGSAMLAVGLEVSPEQVAGTVEAEVMLGPDGLARAVRFME